MQLVYMPRRYNRKTALESNATNFVRNGTGEKKMYPFYNLNPMHAINFEKERFAALSHRNYERHLMITDLLNIQ